MFASRMLRRWIRTGKTNRIRGHQSRPIRLQLSSLEERAVPATYTVNTLVDENDGIGVGGVSLRDAVAAANADGSAGPHIINFSVTGTSTLTLDQILINAPSGLTITGPGAGSLTISGAAAAGANNRIFDINVAAGNPTISISGLTLANGNLNNAAGNNGAAIRVNNDPVVIDGVTFNNNLTAATGTTSGGGAIAVVAATSVTINGSVFTGNKATGTSATGGAIRVGAAATVNITSTSFTSNQSTGVGGAINLLTAISTITVDSSTFTSNQGSSGGAIAASFTGVTVNLKASTFTSNNATSEGGALQTGVQTFWDVDQCKFINNTATSNGGAVRMTSTSPTFNVHRSSFEGNTSNANGGAIYFLGSSVGTFTIENSTFATNSAVTAGGALWLGSSATYTLNNNTFSANTVSGSTTASGGGAINVNAAATVNINNSTIVNNTANGASATGGGIRRATLTGSTTIISSIVAKNTSGSGGSDMNFVGAGSVNVVGGANLIGVSDVGNFTLDTSAGVNQTGTSGGGGLDPIIGPLLFNDGGTTKTHKLLAGSLGVDNGSQNGLALDQNGQARPATGADIGSVESNPGGAIAPQAKATAPNVPPATATYVVTVTYTDNIGINTGDIDLDDIRVAGVGYAAPEAPISKLITSGMMGDMTVTVDYTFNAPAGGWDFADNGSYSVQMQTNQVSDTEVPANAVFAGPKGSFTVAMPLPSPLVVDNAGDGDDSIYTPNNLTLREAIRLTNAEPGSNTITFAAALNGQTITFGSQLSITDALEISGPGAAQLTLDGTGATNTRAFNIDLTASGQAVVISKLTIQNFNVTGDGGGINNIDANLTLTGMVIKNNFASTDGGGINLDAASSALTLNNCVIKGNTATGGDGGGINAEVNTTVSISQSSIQGNIASGTSGDGGGIMVLGTASTLIITDSTLSGNQSGNTGTTAQGGGAIYLNGASTLTLTNSTISGNSAVASGGGVHVDDAGIVTVLNSTIFGNTAGTNGGGFDLRLGAAVLNLTSTIVAMNTANTAGPDVFGSTSATVNAEFSNLGNSSGITTLNQPNPNVLDMDPLLAPLADNGGFLLPDGTKIQTHAIQAGSPVLNQGSNPQSLSFDQRGTGFARTLGSGTDIGAFELFSTIPSAKATAPTVPPALGTITVTVDYTDETGINTGGISTGDIRLTGPAFAMAAIPTSANFSGSGKMVTATYVFDAPLGGWQWFHNGKYSINMQAGEVFDTDGPNAVPAGVIGSFVVTMPLPNPLVVDNSGDTDDGNYLANNLTLREAVQLANQEAGANTISFAGTLTGQTISVGSALKITDGVTITGLGASNLTLLGGGTSRIFDLNIPGVGGDVSLSGMTVSGGNATTGIGGGITLTDENLTLTGMVVSGNSITGAGGGIGASGAATITVGNSTISNNTASTTGAGIHLGGVGAITITNSTLNANTATTTGGAIHTASTVTLNISDSTISNNSGSTGGGVRVINSGSTTTVLRSTVSGNTATAAGGGFYVSGGTLTVTYSTFSGNTAATSGGGIGMTSTNLTMTNSTVSGNTANGTGTTGGGGLSGTSAVMNINNSTITGNMAPTGAGGGIRKTSATGTVTLQSTIVGANSANTGNGQDIHGTVAITVAGDNNLVQDNVNGAFTLSGIGNVVGVDPLLSVLASNGGPTQTHSLQPGSPASNAGSNLLGLMFDQRGSGNPRELGGLVDIGSFEGVSVIPSAKATAPNVPPALADVTVTVIYSDETGINTTKIDVNDVKLSGPGYPVAVSPTSAGFMGSGMSVTATYVFPTPVGGWDYTQNGKYTITMQANEVFDTDAVPNSVFPGPIGNFVVAIPLPPLVVDKIGDDVDGNFGPGQFTLREALGLTNGSASPLNSISFAPSLFAGGAQTITLTGSEMVISKDVTITGPGANKLTIDANNGSRIFNINNGVTAKMDVTITGMTLAKGQSTGSVSAVASGGGAIFIESENVTLDGLELRDNISASFGGAIMSNSGSTLLVTNSSLHHNTANGGDSTQGGGAIQLQFLSGGSMIIRNSTLAFNLAGATTTSSVGGAIIGYSGVPNLVIENCTITQNTAHQAGGVRSFSASGSSVIVRSSIISGNIGLTSQPDLQTGSATPWTISDTLIGSTVGFGGSVTMDAFTSSNIGYAVQLGPVQNNGGLTSTMELLKTNTVGIDQGSNNSGLLYDQRGPGFARSSGAGVDIGAYEIQAAAPPQVTNIKVNDGTPQRSLVTSMKVSFSEPVNLAAGAFVLQRYANGSAGTIGLTINQAGNDVTLTFNNTGTIALDPGGSLPDGTYELTIVANNVTGTLGGGSLDGNKNGTAQGSPADDVSSKLHRLFGDADGNGSVTAIDFNAFRLVYGTMGASFFDFNNDGNVSALDFNEFRLRYGATGFLP